MTLTELLQILGTVLGISAVLAILIGNIFYVLRSQTGKIQKEQLHQLKEEIATCESKHQDSQKDIHRLQGQIDVLKDIPLKDINKDIANISKTNKQILDTLKTSADALKADTIEEVKERRTVSRKLKEA